MTSVRFGKLRAVLPDTGRTQHSGPRPFGKMVKPKYKGRSTINPSNASTNPDRVQGAGGQNMRDRATIRRLNMYRQKERRNSRGKVIKPLQYQSTVASGTVARVEPNIKWFGNTRVIKQSSLQKFQEEMDTVLKDPYKVVMKQSKLPMSLLHDRIRPHVRRRMPRQTPGRALLTISVPCFSCCRTNELSETSPLLKVSPLV